MLYFYIHGLNSTGAYVAAQLSRILCTNVKRLCWNEVDSFDKNLYELLEQIKDQTNNLKEDFIIIGSSLGGFYANQIANILQVPCVLFNPALDVHDKNLINKLKNIEFYNNLDIDKMIASYPTETTDELLPRLIVVGKNDEILDANKTIQYWHGKCNLIITEDKHQIDFFDDFKDDIIQLSTPLFYDINEVCV